ncbi:oligopeptide ABC transporter ATP-binding protein [Lactiplantibacillus plantarum subsp. plantarum]|nr:oligopeptide ABC transporter ATP-binding protein [Lactiplantibacillus plantarum subsp. plantarum]
MPDERKKILEVRHLKQYFNVGKKMKSGPLMTSPLTFMKVKHLG